MDVEFTLKERKKKELRELLALEPVSLVTKKADLDSLDC